MPDPTVELPRSITPTHQSRGALRDVRKSAAAPRAWVPAGLYGGAPRLLPGAVQWTGNAFRITARVVNTETGVGQQTAGDSGQGGSAELQMAIEGVFRHLAGR